MKRKVFLRRTPGLSSWTGPGNGHLGKALQLQLPTRAAHPAPPQDTPMMGIRLGAGDHGCLLKQMHCKQDFPLLMPTNHVEDWQQSCLNATARHTLPRSSKAQ